jgi:hypothetical protein
MQLDKLSPDERKELAAQISVKLSQWQAEDKAAAEQLARMKIEQEAWQRHFDADHLVRDLYGSSYGHDVLRTAIEDVLADLPVTPLDDAELGRLKRRHDAQHIIKQIVALRGHPLSPANEALIQTKLEAVMAAIPVKEGKQND